MSFDDLDDIFAFPDPRKTAFHSKKRTFLELLYAFVGLALRYSETICQKAPNPVFGSLLTEVIPDGDAAVCILG